MREDMGQACILLGGEGEAGLQLRTVVVCGGDKGGEVIHDADT